jgi:hypothetical protein
MSGDRVASLAALWRERATSMSPGVRETYEQCADELLAREFCEMSDGSRMPACKGHPMTPVHIDRLQVMCPTCGVAVGEPCEARGVQYAPQDLELLQELHEWLYDHADNEGFGRDAGLFAERLNRYL